MYDKVCKRKPPPLLAGATLKAGLVVEFDQIPLHLDASHLFWREDELAKLLTLEFAHLFDVVLRQRQRTAVGKRFRIGRRSDLLFLLEKARQMNRPIFLVELDSIRDSLVGIDSVVFVLSRMNVAPRDSIGERLRQRGEQFRFRFDLQIILRLVCFQSNLVMLTGSLVADTKVNRVARGLASFLGDVEKGDERASPFGCFRQNFQRSCGSCVFHNEGIRSNGLVFVNVFFCLFFALYSIVIQIPSNLMGLEQWFYSTHFANSCITIYYNIIQMRWGKVKGSRTQHPLPFCSLATNQEIISNSLPASFPPSSRMPQCRQVFLSRQVFVLCSFCNLLEVGYDLFKSNDDTFNTIIWIEMVLLFLCIQSCFVFPNQIVYLSECFVHIAWSFFAQIITSIACVIRVPQGAV